MQLRPLGSSGLLVSPICLGTMTFGTPVGEEHSIRLIHEAIDAGINFIDTANVYEGYARYLGSAGGLAEEIIGKALRDRRHRVILATKVGAPVGPGPQDRGLSAVHILRELDRSLRRLQTDVIDLYVMHWPDRFVPPAVTLDAVETALRQGKIRYFGVSNHTAWQLCEFLWLAEKQGGPRVVASQIPYSLLRRELHHDLSFCDKHGIGVTPYQALQGGLLTGKYRRHRPPPADSRAAEKPEWVWQQDDALFSRLEAVESLSEALGVPMSRYALAAALAQCAMTSLIVGVKNSEQLHDALAATEVVIPAEHWPRIDAACPLPWRLPDPVRD